MINPAPGIDRFWALSSPRFENSIGCAKNQTLETNSKSHSYVFLCFWGPTQKTSQGFSVAILAQTTSRLNTARNSIQKECALHLAFCLRGGMVYFDFDELEVF